MRVNGRGRWLRRVWEGLRRVLRGEVWDASPLSPREAEIEAEMAALEERVLRLLEEVRGRASGGDAKTAGAGRDARAPGNGERTAGAGKDAAAKQTSLRAPTAGAGGTPALRVGETGETSVPQRRQEQPGAEGDLRKALEEEIRARACGATGAGEAGGTPAGETGETPVPQRRQEQPGAEGDLRKALEEEIWARACGAAGAGEAGGTPALREGETGETPLLQRYQDQPGGQGGATEAAVTEREVEAAKVVLRGVPQGICGQMTGRAGGARFWEGVL
ncbi:MAG: hypothetical protein ABFE07_03960 [Armatimonadia bacterium]